MGGVELAAWAAIAAVVIALAVTLGCWLDYLLDDDGPES